MSDGKLLAVTAGSGSFYLPAKIQSPNLPQSSESCEIHFYHYM